MAMIANGCRHCPSLGATWTETIQDMLTSWSQAGQDVIRAWNQPKVMETGTGGTVVYQTPGGAVGPVGAQRSVTPIENVVGAGVSTTILVIGAVVVVALLMSRRGD